MLELSDIAFTRYYNGGFFGAIIDSDEYNEHVKLPPDCIAGFNEEKTKLLVIGRNLYEYQPIAVFSFNLTKENYSFYVDALNEFFDFKTHEDDTTFSKYIERIKTL